MNRRTLALALALALVVALVPMAASAPTPVCAEDACRIEQNSLAYLPPVAFVPEGAAVTFGSLDTSHVTADGISPGGTCLFASSAPGNDPPPTAFTIEDAGLFGTTAGLGTVLCATAIALPNGDFALPYQCVLHGHMRGMLVVTAAS